MTNISEETRIPVATYRLQFNLSFTLQQATECIDYFHELGISNCYASPLMKAKAGSTHCYDVVDYSEINPEIGSFEQLLKFSDRLKSLEMGLLLDFVPNHMCISGSQNPWWNDVLENGPSSPYASFFSINWKPPKEELLNKVLLPFLQDQYGQSLENQDISLSFSDGCFYVLNQANKLPTDPCSWTLILEPLVKRILMAKTNIASEELSELQSVITALDHLPATDNLDPKKIEERQREKQIIKKRINRLIQENKDLEVALQDFLIDINGKKGDPASFDQLEDFLKKQSYRLSYWRVANDEVNYRRFFDVNHFAGICVEKFHVFTRVHQLLFEWINQGIVTGVRIDHIDGLCDPQHYLWNMQNGASLALNVPIKQNKKAINNDFFELIRSEKNKSKQPLYIVVEKILCDQERLREEWPVKGSTGYDFLDALNRIYVYQPNNLLTIYEDFTQKEQSVFKLLYSCRIFILTVSLASELHTLAIQLGKIAEHYRWSRDFSLDSLMLPLRAIIACLPVYRTYVYENQISDLDKQYILYATHLAKRFNPATSTSVFNFIQKVLLLEFPEGLEEAGRNEWKEFVIRIQQMTGAVMAKGVEDTAFYRYHLLTSLNEVGSKLGTLGLSSKAFHEFMMERADKWPHSLSTTFTHDTKKSEDCRARINVLSEISTEWQSTVKQWHELNKSKIKSYDSLIIPEKNEEYLLYQILVGSWPLYQMDAKTNAHYIERIVGFMNKALKEAKAHTSWINPDEEYENAMSAFVRSILILDENNAFIKNFNTFIPKIMWAGMMNALSQTVLKITCPGVPDFYQGSELWDFSLVDPDNRHPVIDYPHRRKLLGDLLAKKNAELALLVDHLMKTPEDGRIKMYTILKGLTLRKDLSTLFKLGSYVPLAVEGHKENNVITFLRAYEGGEIVVATVRFFAELYEQKHISPEELWQGNAIVLPPEHANATFLDIFTGVDVSAIQSGDNWVLPCDQLFAHLPYAILIKVK